MAEIVKMSEKEYREMMYRDNHYKCGFCGKEITGKPTLTLCLCKGFAGYDIADICEECLEKVRKKVIS